MKRILHRFLMIGCLLSLTVGSLSARQPADRAKAEDASFRPQYIVGVHFVPEWQICLSDHGMMGLPHPYDGKFSAGAGISFEARLTRRSGIETGLYYRYFSVDSHNDQGPYGPIWMPFSSWRYLSIPVLYKFHSPIVNVSAGFNYDILVDKTGTAYYEHENPNRYGLMLKISKDITLCKGLFVEPEFHYNQVWQEKIGDSPWPHAWIGLSIGLKYRF